MTFDLSAADPGLVLLGDVYIPPIACSVGCDNLAGSSWYLSEEVVALPHDVDILVGKRIRMRRSELSMSQSQLGDRLGLTFQQIQKYEAGSNRVSCSRLAELCAILDVPVTFFFASEDGDPVALLDNLDLSLIKDGRRLISAFQKIATADMRRLAVTLMENIAASSESEEKTKQP